MLEIKQKSKRRTFFKSISKRKIHEKSFTDSLKKLKQDWNHLLNCHSLAKDPKFLRRMAINIKQIHHDIKNAKHPKKWESDVYQLFHFLSTPLGAPFVAKMTLVEATDNFSEQEPKHSDLSELLNSFAHFKVNFVR